MPAEVAPLYLQIAGPGALWIMVHCGGMCGPVIAGLQFGRDGWAEGAVRLGLYQGGRAIALGAAGAVCALAGIAASDAIELWSPWFVLALAAAMLLAVLHRLGWMPWPRGGGDGGGLAVRLVRPLGGFAARRPRIGSLALGIALGALPCGVVFWVLGLSAASGSVVHGALLPAVLVAISTVPLAVAAGAGAMALAPLRRRLAWMPSAALAVSALWLGAHGAAALGWIGHVHLGKVMLW